MHFKKLGLLAAVFSFLSISNLSHASDFDNYLQKKGIVDAQFNIQNKDALNELVIALSEEDSKTFPLEIDHNTILEKLEMNADRTILTGVIITPDFAQFEKDLGKKEVVKIIQKNLLKNCPIFFEHEYQKRNPYLIELKLSSTTTIYELNITQKDCGV